MLQDNQLGHTSETGPSPESPVAQPVAHFQDRALPRSAHVLAFLFKSGAAVCLLSISILAMFLGDLVATQGDTLLAPLLGAVGVVTVAGALLLEYGYAKALAGYRSLREGAGRKVDAGMACLAFLVLCLVHPFLGLGIAFAAASAALVAWRDSRHLPEPLWDFNTAEAVAILAGRDPSGLRMARSRPAITALHYPLLRAITWLSVLAVVATSSALVTMGVLNSSAMLGATLITLWSADALAGFIMGQGPAARQVTGLSDRVEVLSQNETPDAPGLRVSGLNVHLTGGGSLLSNISFEVPPGSVVGITGPSGVGKTLLCQALASPYDLVGMSLRGEVTLNGTPLWARQAKLQALPILFMPEVPLLLPSSGQDNLTCFHEGAALQRGQQHLEQLVFSVEDAQAICDTPDATRLPAMKRRALAMARAFLLSPSVYLMDRPEDGVSDAFVVALCSKIAQEVRLGRSFMLITDNRALLEMCDKIMVLQEGRLVDFGDAQEVREKISNGWSRLVALRALSLEEHLILWCRNLFKRPGDEANRRNVGLICSELLAFSCQTVSGLEDQNITFEFKHFENYGLLRMIDSDPVLSSAALERARIEAEAGDDVTRVSPLATVMRGADSVDSSSENGQRVITVKVPTFDPRKTKGARVDDNTA
ncbi:ATP-binding cassette domain-containing protein [Sulfitobacter sp. F26204]|uniref:ATP-binding cassette domain-containing protein n=1 Tax=Sulfitobacter sp. F26204 TaxID=2996014 RepID=UPI00225E11C8|nr:ATP-binding cassette domain-containing protein [Sulfitobacter sp. F26204]MCX7560505.1 ATP-binding cassette domain-containing protein [Sulfitobacter sp. F26204]